MLLPGCHHINVLSAGSILCAISLLVLSSLLYLSGRLEVLSLTLWLFLSLVALGETACEQRIRSPRGINIGGQVLSILFFCPGHELASNPRTLEGISLSFLEYTLRDLKLGTIDFRVPKQSFRTICKGVSGNPLQYGPSCSNSLRPSGNEPKAALSNRGNACN